MPWCFGLAKALAKRLEGTQVDEEDEICLSRCAVERFVPNSV